MFYRSCLLIRTKIPHRGIWPVPEAGKGILASFLEYRAALHPGQYPPIWPRLKHDRRPVPAEYEAPLPDALRKSERLGAPVHACGNALLAGPDITRPKLKNTQRKVAEARIPEGVDSARGLGRQGFPALQYWLIFR